jgi:hypothetical protein
MPDVIEQLRGELRSAVADRPADAPAAYATILRRGTRRRATVRVAAVTSLVVAFAAVVAAPRLLGPTIGGRHLADPVGMHRTRVGSMPPCPPSVAPGGAPRSRQATSPDLPRVPPEDSCKEPPFSVAPGSTAAGTAVDVSGSCRTVLEGRASTVSVMLSLRSSREYTGQVLPDGSFHVPVELPWRLLPARYQVTVSCEADKGQAGFSGAATLGGRLIDVTKPEPAARGGNPEPDSLRASLRPGPEGRELVLQGRGCYLSALNGARGLVRIVYSLSGDDPGNSGARPANWYDAVPVEPGPDGSWRTVLRRGDSSPPYDVYAYCTDDLGSLGFIYRPVYRVEVDRLRPIEVAGA